ncbi:MAG: YeeE/YedE family protein [Alphaproteobacteria bacterium]|nr:YeeE/YedE family protein [Alphaproteobacteria bacterium]
MPHLRTRYLATAAVSGGLFGAGLYVSQMVDAKKVLRFLDVTAIPSGGWDPSLAFVIVPAILVMFIAVQLSKRRQAPLFDSQFHQPEYDKIDGRLIGGALLFGMGWGMAGICPGPAIALIAFGPENLAVFLVTMLIGSYAGSMLVPSGHARRVADAR